MNGSLVCGKALENLNLPEGILIIAVIRHNEMLVPNGKTVLEAGDRIVLFSMHEVAPKMQKIFSSEGKFKDALNSIRNRGSSYEL